MTVSAPRARAAAMIETARRYSENAGETLNMGNLARFWARWRPEEVAVAFAEEQITWVELNDRSDRVAGGLAARGVGCGDRVGVLMLNCPAYLELAIACMKRGSVLVPLNVRLSPPELAWIIDHSQCALLVADDSLGERLRDACRASERPQRFHVGHRLPAGARPYAELYGDRLNQSPALGSRSPLFLCYTSGTTGRPKGALLGHGAVHQQAVNQLLAHRLTSDERILLPFPLAFTGGLVSVACLSYVLGAKLYLEPTFEPGRALQLLTEEQITVFQAVPQIWQAIAELEAFADADLSALKVAKSGGGPVPPSLLATYQHKGVAMTQGYGLTEGGGHNIILHERDALRKLGSAGVPLIHTEARVVHDDDGADAEPGKVGELWLRGPEVMLGYWRDEQATAETLGGGWLRTGDLATIDEDGYITIVDRKKDMFISGGLNVYPAEIERVLSAQPGVAEVAVIGRRHERWGEVPVAIVRGEASLDPDQLRQAAAAELADYKVPKEIVLTGEPLPRNMAGKVLKEQLRAKYGASHAWSAR